MNFTKYKNKRVSHAGYSFASKGEASLYDYLKFREMAGEIKNIQTQDHVYLTRARILYIPDFKIFEVGLNDYTWSEFKGFETDTWKIKRRLWQFYGPGLLRVYKKNSRGVFLHEEIVPKLKTGDMEHGEIQND